MKTKQKHLIARIATVAIIAASVLQYGVLPAFAAGTATGMKDILDRNKVSVTAVGHAVSMTLPSGTVSGTLTLTYTNFTAFAGTPTGTCTSGTVGSGTASVNVATVTLTSCTAGALTITAFTGTNPSSPGSNLVTLGGTAGITGTFAVTTVTDDQVSITASIDPSITFNVGSQASASACDGTFAGNGGTVALGTLTTGAVTSSDASSVAHICSRVTTNSGSGAAVTVKSLNAALKSTGTPTDTIASASATLTSGTSGYGLCAGSAGGDSGKDATTPVGASPGASSPFNGSCTNAAHAVGGLTTGAQNVWTIATASQNAFFRMYVKAAISGTVPAHSDYADTLTFVATGTF